MKSLEARKRLLIAEANLQRTLLCLEIESMRLNLQDAAWKALVTGTLTSMAGSLLRGGRAKGKSVSNEKGPPSNRPGLIGRIMHLYEVGTGLWRIFQSIRSAGPTKGIASR